MQFERKQILGVVLIAVALFWNTKGGKDPTPEPVPMPEGVKIPKPDKTYDLEAKVVEVMKGETAARDSKVLAYMLYRVGEVLKKDGQSANSKYKTKEQAVELLQRSMQAAFPYVGGKYTDLGELLIGTLEKEKFMVQGQLTAEERAKLVGVTAAFSWALDQVK